MPVLRIYADYRKISIDSKGDIFVPMTCYRTLQELSLMGIVLEPDMSVTLYMESESGLDEEIEYAGVIQYDILGHFWLAKFDPEKFHFVKAQCSTRTSVHPCIQCGYELSEYLQIHELQPKTTCPQCGTNVNLPLFPPGIESQDILSPPRRPFFLNRIPRGKKSPEE